MATARRISRTRIGVIAVILLAGFVLLALAPAKNADATDRLAARLRLELPDLSVAPSHGLLQNDMLYVSADGKGAGPDPLPIARLRPVSREAVRVAMYDRERHVFAKETLMDMPSAVSRIGLAATGL
jgi:hypothetical protein